MNDAELLRKIAEGDRQSFVALYSRHKDLVYGLARRLLADAEKAEEVSQEVWLKVVRHAKSFSEQPGLEGGGVRAWVSAITRNWCLNELAKKKEFLVADVSPESVIEEVDPAPLASEILEMEMDLLHFKKGLEQLHPSQRACLVLWMETHKPYEELAQDLKTSVAHVKVLMFRARQSLQKWMKGGIHER